MPTAELNAPALALLVVALALSGFLLFRTQRYFARAARAGSDPRSGGDSYRVESAGPPREAQRWEVEMHELAREVSGRLDSKMRVLEHLVAEAYRAAARLEAALAKVQPGSAAASAGPRPESAGPRPESVGLRPKSAGLRPKSAGQTPQLEEPASPSDPSQAVCEEVYTLSDYGYPAAEIAQRLRLSLKETEQILSLRK